MKHKIEIEIDTNSMVEVFKLEGAPIPLEYSAGGKWKTFVEDFNIEGKLDVYLYCTGINGTPWNLKIKVDGSAIDDPMNGEIKKGYSVFQKEIDLPPQKRRESKR